MLFKDMNYLDELEAKAFGEEEEDRPKSEVGKTNSNEDIIDQPQLSKERMSDTVEEVEKKITLKKSLSFIEEEGSFHTIQKLEGNY